MSANDTNAGSEDRPKITVRAQKAVTCEIIIHTNAGDVRIIAGHERLIIQSQPASMIEIEVQP